MILFKGKAKIKGKAENAKEIRIQLKEKLKSFNKAGG